MQRIVQLNTTLSVIYWLLFIVVFGALCVFMQHYIDFTDQGSYLQFYIAPQDIHLAPFSYYFYVSPLFHMVEQNLYHFRLLGLFLLLLGCIPLGYAIISSVLPDIPARLFWPVYFLGVISFYRTFVIVLGYKWFLLIAVMFFLTGFIRLLYQNENKPNLTIGGLWIGLGGCMAYLAKAPSAAVLAVLFAGYLFYLYLSKKATYAKITLSALAAGMIVLAGVIIHLLFFESLGTHIARLSNTLELIALMQSGHTLVPQIIRSISGLLHLPIVFISCGLFAFVAMAAFHNIASLKRLSYQWPLLAVLMLIGTVCIGIIATKVILQHSLSGLGLKEFIFILCLCIVLFVAKYLSKDGLKITDKNALILAVVTYVVTHAYRAGSAAEYLFVMNYLGVFYYLIVLFLCRAFLSPDRFRHVTLFIVLPLMTVLFVKVWESYDFPYASNVPVYRQTYKTQLTSDPRNVLYLDELSHRYITTVRQAFVEHGFSPNQTIVDMTGVTPIITYLSKGRVLPFNWISGQVDGASAATLHALKKVSPQDLSQAWLLMPAHSPARNYDLDPRLLAELGLVFPNHYKKVAQMQSPYPSEDTHALWKPIIQPAIQVKDSADVD